MKFTQNINTLFGKLQTFLRTETIIGDPIQVGNITLVPIISVSFGAGSGSGSDKGHKGNDGAGGGAGAGGKITPNAILVIKNDEVSVIPLNTLNNSKKPFDKILEMVPEIVSKVKVKPEEANRKA